MPAFRRQFDLLQAAWLLFATLVPAAQLSAGEPVDPAKADRTPLFETDVVPILRAYCWKCHGGEGLAAGLDLRTLPLALQGGENGPALVPGSAQQSRMVARIEAGEMPPGNELKPTADHLATLRQWIDQGARARYPGGPLTEADDPPVSDAERQWWSFRKPIRPPVPAVAQRGRVANPIDAFLLEALEQRGLAYAPPADPHALLRRLSLDLIGLPPSPDEIAAFTADPSEAAYSAVVERLLASPHYGERWGRHWLDAAGYSDAIGTDNDASIIEERERNWKYRDYVVDAFNRDLPYDRFLLEQLAGDELVDWRDAEQPTAEMRALLAATGFLRQAADVTYAPELNTSDIRHQVLFDTVQIVSTNLLGLTLQCAQCHTHKFDPIAHADYYRFAAFFTPAYNPQNWLHSKARWLPDVPPKRQAEIDAHNAAVDSRVALLEKQAADTRAAIQADLFEKKLAGIPETLRPDVRAALTLPPDQRNEVQKDLAEKLAPQLAVTPQEIEAALSDEVRRALAEGSAEIERLRVSKRSYDRIQALWETGPAPATFLYRRGDHEAPGPPVEPGVPRVLDDPANPFRIPEDHPAGSSSSGRRLALARWLTRPDHPLTARVYVNRVWQHHFGRGIVATPDNFGLSGARPTHPALLDWLACEFAARGWSTKALHRLIVHSHAYRQASRIDPHDAASIARARAAAAADPDNLLLWKMPLRRLESEIVRDSILQVAGSLDRTAGGSPLALQPNPDGSVEVKTSGLTHPDRRFRRSLYLFARRNYQLTELSLFDQPIVAHNCTRRTSTAVVLQSLAMLNGAFVLDMSDRLADEVRRELPGEGPDIERTRIGKAFLRVLGREPDAEELADCTTFLERQRALQPGPDADRAAWAALCQMLLNTNEFLYAP